MQKLAAFIKKNIVSILLVLVVLYLFSQNTNRPLPLIKEEGFYNTASSVSLVGAPARTSAPSSYDESTNLDAGERLVSENISASLKVASVEESIFGIKSKAESLSGFMVSSSFNNPGEKSSGSISVRVPSANQDEFTNYLKSSSIKVVTLDVNASDVTDQYTDTTERLRILQKNKQSLESIMDSAQTAEEKLSVQNSIFTIQRQIEQLEGAKKYIEDTSKVVFYYTFYITRKLIFVIRCCYSV